MAPQSYYYTMAVAGYGSSYSLLAKANEFIAWFKKQPQRREIEKRWQGSSVTDSLSFRDEPGNLLGEAELKTAYLEHCQKFDLEPVLA